MVEALTEEHKQELSEVFKIFDEKGKGHLDVRELGACFRCFGYVATDADLQEQVNEVGGTVDFIQFVHIMTKKMKDCDVISEIKEAFKQLDTNGDMYITKDELKEGLFNLLGRDLRVEEVEEMLREADVDGDGKISQLDFINVLT